MSPMLANFLTTFFAGKTAAQLQEELTAKHNDLVTAESELHKAQTAADEATLKAEYQGGKPVDNSAVHKALERVRTKKMAVEFLQTKVAEQESVERLNRIAEARAAYLATMVARRTEVAAIRAFALAVAIAARTRGISLEIKGLEGALAAHAAAMPLAGPYECVEAMQAWLAAGGDPDGEGHHATLAGHVTTSGNEQTALALLDEVLPILSKHAGVDFAKHAAGIVKARAAEHAAEAARMAAERAKRDSWAAAAQTFLTNVVRRDTIVNYDEFTAVRTAMTALIEGGWEIPTRELTAICRTFIDEKLRKMVPAPSPTPNKDYDLLNRYLKNVSVNGPPKRRDELQSAAEHDMQFGSLG